MKPVTRRATPSGTTCVFESAEPLGSGIRQVDQVKRQTQPREQSWPFAERGPESRRGIWQRRQGTRQGLDVLSVLAAIGMQGHVLRTLPARPLSGTQCRQDGEQHLVARDGVAVGRAVEPGVLPAGNAIHKTAGGDRPQPFHPLFFRIGPGWSSSEIAGGPVRDGESTTLDPVDGVPTTIVEPQVRSSVTAALPARCVAIEVFGEKLAHLVMPGQLLSQPEPAAALHHRREALRRSPQPSRSRRCIEPASASRALDRSPSRASI